MKHAIEIKVETQRVMQLPVSLPDYPNMPDYRHTDKHARLEMTLKVCSAMRVETHGQTDRRTDRRYQVHYLPASLKLHGQRV